MNRVRILFLRSVTVLIGITALVFLLWEPHLEGRNAHATLFALYFKDPFLAYAYIASIPFFMGLYQAFKALGYAGQNKEFLPEVMRSLGTIRHCALMVIGFVAVGEVVIFLSDSDDRAGGVFMGILIVLASIAVAMATTVLERKL